MAEVKKGAIVVGPVAMVLIAAFVFVTNSGDVVLEVEDSEVAGGIKDVDK